MALDNETVCNPPGVIQTRVGWIALVLALALVALALITGPVGEWRTRKRRSR
jgi:hypothetical protein